MLETKRSPSVGRPGPWRARAEEVAEPVARHHDLPDDLAGRQVAHQPLRAGVAERAVERAADLARQAERAAVGLRDVDALDLVRPLARRSRRAAAAATCACRRPRPARPRPRAAPACNARRARRAAPSTRWSSARSFARRARRASARSAARASSAAPACTPIAPSASASAARVRPTSDGLAGGT